MACLLIVSAMSHHCTAQVIANVMQGIPTLSPIKCSDGSSKCPPSQRAALQASWETVPCAFIFVSADWSAFASGKHFVNG